VQGVQFLFDHDGAGREEGLNMPSVCVQFQPGRVGEAEGEVYQALRKAFEGARFDVGEDEGRYVNISFDAESAEEGLGRVRRVFELPGVGEAARGACIVVCEGGAGVGGLFDAASLRYGAHRCAVSGRGGRLIGQSGVPLRRRDSFHRVRRNTLGVPRVMGETHATEGAWRMLYGVFNKPHPHRAWYCSELQPP